MIVDIVDKYCTNDNNPIKNLRLENRLRIRGKNLCVHGEDAKSNKTVYISVNNNTNLKSF
jgi:hypothetical protein